MATTVTYKGETLTTVRNDTKTLKTGGTWVEGDIGITDETGTAVVAVEDVPDSHGGIEKRITAVDISDTDATASDVAQGKVFYSSAGTRTTGTATIGGYSIEDIASGEPTGAITVTGTSIANYAFHSKGITSVSAPNVTSIGVSAFEACTLTKIDGDDFGDGETQVVCDSTSFGHNNAITTIEFNSPFGNKGGYQFRQCTNMTSAIFHKPFTAVGTSNGRCFYGCSKLAYIDYAYIDAINNDHHSGCPITALVIRNTDTVPELKQTNAGGVGTKIINGEGYIYVPQAMISAYESATNWSNLAGRFLPIEGSIYE